MTLSFTERFIAARCVTVPIIGIETSDPAATIKTITRECSKVPYSSQIFTWDSASGVAAWSIGEKQVDDLAQKTLTSLKDNAQITSPIEFFCAIASIKVMPEKSIVIVKQSTDWFDNPIVRQAIWNLRDIFKNSSRCLVLLADSFELPPSLKNDVIIIEEPLPDEEQLTKLVTDLDLTTSRCDCTRGQNGTVKAPISGCKKCNGTGMKIKRPLAGEDAISRVVEAVKGLSYFGAEQVVSMALRGSTVEKQKPVCGIDLEHCWLSKRKMVEQTKGLSIYRGGEKFDDLGGLDQIKTYLTRIMTGRKAPKLIVWLDEIEKTGLASRNDTSGVNQDQEGTLLSWMEDYDVFGVMLLGVPGCGKSAICKAVGSEYDRVVIRIDLGGMQDSLVGESQKGIRSALKVIQAIGGNDTLWLATSNSISGLSSAMKSRFTDTFFFDLPPKDERQPIWNVWLNKFGIDDKPFDDDDDWVARDIRHCCDKAYRMGITIAEAATYITPVGLVDREEIERLRNGATNRYLSASHEGVYKIPEKASEGRTINL